MQRHVGLPQRRHSRWRLPVWGRPATVFGSSCTGILWTLMELTVPEQAMPKYTRWMARIGGLQYGRRRRGASLGRRLGRRARSRPGGRRRRSRPSIAGPGRAHAAGPAQADFGVCNREATVKTVKLIQAFPGSWATNHRNFGNPDPTGRSQDSRRPRSRQDCR